MVIRGRAGNSAGLIARKPRGRPRGIGAPYCAGRDRGAGRTPVPGGAGARVGASRGAAVFPRGCPAGRGAADGRGGLCHLAPATPRSSRINQPARRRMRGTGYWVRARSPPVQARRRPAPCRHRSPRSWLEQRSIPPSADRMLAERQFGGGRYWCGAGRGDVGRGSPSALGHPGRIGEPVEIKACNARLRDIPCRADARALRRRTRGNPSHGRRGFMGRIPRGQDRSGAAAEADAVRAFAPAAAGVGMVVAVGAKKRPGCRRPLARGRARSTVISSSEPRLPGRRARDGAGAEADRRLHRRNRETA